ncbi:hypothetical protein RFI_26281 [Reticulomyxa filosa]|uniref:SAM domain-containing protein n=1 Tax=Reticulomyxa filosa TaxID=46433 RepID=X6MCC4_RETFI|nr:hypothetical protein RFI_26281 [Reticulomyxa filosa]|eukprot:ETO11092.1 hypothetical protein RFI_26281 [Reticulomyxa filosa]
MGLTKYGKRIIDDGIDGNILLNDMTKEVLTNEMQVNSLHVGKIIRAIEELRKLNGIENDTPQKDWHVLADENKKFTQELENAQVRTQEMNNQLKELELELQQWKARVNNTTAGLDTTEEPTTETNMADMETELVLYKSELERLCQEKVLLTAKASEEISYLRTAVKVLNGQLHKGSYFKNLKNPMDVVAESLGYSKAK